jgi:hypothetical protein
MSGALKIVPVSVSHPEPRTPGRCHDEKRGMGSWTAFFSARSENGLIALEMVRPTRLWWFSVERSTTVDDQRFPTLGATLPTRMFCCLRREIRVRKLAVVCLHTHW